jgi:hypothetical protein
MKTLRPMEYFFLSCFISATILVMIGFYGISLYEERFQPWAHETLSPEIGRTEFAWVVPYVFSGFGFLSITTIGYGCYVYEVKKND